MVWRRFDRWSRASVFAPFFKTLQGPDFDRLLIDTTRIGAHQHTVRARKRRPRQTLQPSVKGSGGGLTTKQHAVTDASSNPLGLLVTPGQRSDVRQAGALLAGYSAGSVMANKGYDADGVHLLISSLRTQAVILPQAYRLVKRSYNRDLYRERNRIERVFGCIKHYCRVAPRYDKTVRTYLGFGPFATTLFLL